MPRYSVEPLSKEVRYSDLFGAMSFLSALHSLEPIVIKLDTKPVMNTTTGLYRLIILRSRIALACRRIKEHFAVLGEAVIY